MHCAQNWTSWPSRDGAWSRRNSSPACDRWRCRYATAMETSSPPSTSRPSPTPTAANIGWKNTCQTCGRPLDSSNARSDPKKEKSRTEELRVGQEGDSTCRSRGEHTHVKQHKPKNDQQEHKTRPI